MTELETCDALVSDVLMAWRFAPEGEQLCGAHLLRWRQLPAKERAYYIALVAPYVDEHYTTRVSTGVVHNGDGTCTYTYDPPFPEPCDCGRPVFVNGHGANVRCTRCLRAWSARRQAVGECAGEPARYLVRDLIAVDRVDMGYAIEHVLTGPSSPA